MPTPGILPASTTVSAAASSTTPAVGGMAGADSGGYGFGQMMQETQIRQSRSDGATGEELPGAGKNLPAERQADARLEEKASLEGHDRDREITEEGTEPLADEPPADAVALAVDPRQTPPSAAANTHDIPDAGQTVGPAASAPLQTATEGADAALAASHSSMAATEVSDMEMQRESAAAQMSAITTDIERARGAGDGSFAPVESHAVAAGLAGNRAVPSGSRSGLADSPSVAGQPGKPGLAESPLSTGTDPAPVLPGELKGQTAAELEDRGPQALASASLSGASAAGLQAASRGSSRQLGSGGSEAATLSGVQTAGAAALTTVDANGRPSMGAGLSAQISLDEGKQSQAASAAARLSSNAPATSAVGGDTSAALQLAGSGGENAAGLNSQNGTAGGAATAPQAGSASQTATLAARLQDPQWGQVMGQRAIMMAQYGPRVAEIQLDPPELGAMQIRIHLGSQDQVSVSFSSPHAAVRDVIEQQLPRLREMFAEQGLELDQSSVSDQPAREQQEQARRDSAGRGGNAYLGGDGDGGELPLSGAAVAVGLVDYYA